MNLLSLSRVAIPAAMAAALCAAGGVARAAADGGPVFRRDIQPAITRLGCNAVECHGAFAGQGGMSLVLYEGDPAEDFETLVKAERGRRVNRLEPEKSLLLRKATKAIPHGGDQRFKPGSDDYKLFLEWIRRGAPYWDATLPELASLSIAPAEQKLAKDKTAALAVMAVFSDGSKKDVTRQASFRATDEAVVSVAADGKVKAIGFGAGGIVARYLGRTAVARVLVPQPLAGPFPRPKPNNKVDELVFANLETLGLPPSEVCADAVFLRRAYLDATGTLPAADVARAFLADAAPDKRARLVDTLLASDAFNAFWALKWSDILRIKSEDPVSLWPKGAEAYYQFVYQSLAENKPFDRFARELLTATGSDFRNGAVNFYRAVSKRDPQSHGESAALVFLGARLSCARCHGHPEGGWSKEDDLGMAAFFPQVKFKWTSEWKEEVLYRQPDAALRHPRTGEIVRPKFLDGEVCEVPAGADLRAVFADRLVAAGPKGSPPPRFAAALANRVWYWLMGRGIVHEPDDLRGTNPPSNPALLDYLAAELAGHGYDLRHLYRLVLNSKTYQLSSAPHPQSAGDVVHFSHYRERPLTAEQLIDALAQVLGVSPGSFGVFQRPTLAPVTTMPSDLRAIEVSDGSAESPVAMMLGRSARSTGYESDRPAGVREDYVAFLANSKDVENAINASETLREMGKSSKSDAEIVEEIYLSALARLPTEAEKQALAAHLAAPGGNRSANLQNVMWAVLNTAEFMLNH